MNLSVKHAVFPVAGLGTRFLPATKATPKEMLPIIDKPLIQYAVEEAAAAGITQMIFVTSASKRAIEDHFDKNFELETNLAQRQKTELLETVQSIVPKSISCVYVRQPEALGLGHAVGCAQQIVGDNPFAVILADDFIDAPSDNLCLTQMVRTFQEQKNSVLGVERVKKEDTKKYGIVDIHEANDVGEGLSKVTSIVEKPQPEKAPSNLGVVGRYILTPRIFDHINNIGQGAGGEIQLTDAIARLLDEEGVVAHEFSGKRYDCGSKLGYLKATIEMGLKHPEVSQEFREYLVSRFLDKK